VIAMSVKLRDVIKALEQRERYEDAEYYGTIVPFELGIIHGFSENQVLGMTIDEIEMWYRKPPKPLKYEGWNFWWGEAVDADSRERNA